MNAKVIKSCKFCVCKALWKAGIVNGKQGTGVKKCSNNQGETDDRVKYSDKQSPRFYIAELFFVNIGVSPRYLKNVENSFCIME
ncbi:MAG: hypothetical protein II670_14915 [Alphaproteobacteria bacterium]|nr:hypothetical protein [Alphaproteobacteria bacterium]